MSTRAYITQLIHFALYVLVQVALGQELILFNRAFCFLYVGFLLLLPFEIGNLAIMFIGFSTGLSVDLFYDTLGINATAALILTALRPLWINILTPQGGIDPGLSPSLPSMGFSWFFTYASVLIFIHHLVLFFLEAFTFQHAGYTFTKVLSSTAFTLFVVFLIQYLMYRKRRT